MVSSATIFILTDNKALRTGFTVNQCPSCDVRFVL